MLDDPFLFDSFGFAYSVCMNAEANDVWYSNERTEKYGVCTTQEYSVYIYYISCNVRWAARVLCVEVPMSNSAQKIARENKTFCPDVFRCKIRFCIFLLYCTMTVRSWRGEVNTFYMNLLHFSGTSNRRYAAGRLSNLRNLLTSSRKR